MMDEADATLLAENDLSQLDGDCLESMSDKRTQAGRKIAAKQAQFKAEMTRRRCAEAVEKEKPNYVCPISQSLMRDPAVAADGHSYERRQIEQWFAGGKKQGPLTGADLADTKLLPNHNLRKEIDDAMDAAMAAETAATAEMGADGSSGGGGGGGVGGGGGGGGGGGEPSGSKRRRLASDASVPANPVAETRPFIPENRPLSVQVAQLPTACEQRQLLCETLYRLVLQLEPTASAAKITGMILDDCAHSKILHLIESPDALRAKVQDTRRQGAPTRPTTMNK
jgi:hypothetical protein